VKGILDLFISIKIILNIFSTTPGTENSFTKTDRAGNQCKPV
jgi:hypothetical protein